MWNKLGILAGVISALIAIITLLISNNLLSLTFTPEKENPYIGLETDLRLPSDDANTQGNKIENIEIIDISPIKDDYYHLMVKMRITFFYDKQHQKSENTPPRAEVSFFHDGGGILKFKRVKANWARTTHQPWKNDLIKGFQPISIMIRLEAAEFQSKQFAVSLYEHEKSRRDYFYHVIYYRKYTWVRP